MLKIGWKRFACSINEMFWKVLQIITYVTLHFWWKLERRNVAKSAAAKFIVAKVSVFDINITGS